MAFAMEFDAFLVRYAFEEGSEDILSLELNGLDRRLARSFLLGFFAVKDSRHVGSFEFVSRV